MEFPNINRNPLGTQCAVYYRHADQTEVWAPSGLRRVGRPEGGGVISKTYIGAARFI